MERLMVVKEGQEEEVREAQEVAEIPVDCCSRVVLVWLPREPMVLVSAFVPQAKLAAAHQSGCGRTLSCRWRGTQLGGGWQGYVAWSVGQEVAACCLAWPWRRGERCPAAGG